MREVSSIEMIIGAVLGSIAIFLPSAAIYLVVSAVFDVSTVLGVNVFALSMIVIGLAGSALIARVYPGPDRPLEHGWLLAVIFVVLPFAFVSLYLAGVVSSDSSIDFVVEVFTLLSYFLFAQLMALYVKARGTLASLSATKNPPTD